jgi:hypothetical protein
MGEWVLTHEQEDLLADWFAKAKYKADPRPDDATKDPHIRELVELAWDAGKKEGFWENYDSRD